MKQRSISVLYYMDLILPRVLMLLAIIRGFQATTDQGLNVNIAFQALMCALVAIFFVITPWSKWS